DPLQRPIPSPPLSFHSLGHVRSFGSSTSVRPITQTLGQALVFMYLEAYYNRIRLHFYSELDYISPDVFYSGEAT
ncbi:MAG: hypothetical protein LBH85_06830, partial [Treponema sp.]|nr:hypothetical protein [Treponema sp.]